MKKLVLFFVFMAAFAIVLFAQGAGNTMDFDGIDDHFVVTGISELEVDIDKLTLSAWVNFNVLNTPGGYGIITKSSYPNNTNCDFYFGLIAGASSSDPRIQFGMTHDGSVPETFGISSPLLSEFQANFGFSIDIDKWYFLTLTFDRGIMAKIYVNGIEVASETTIPDLPIHGSTQPLWFAKGSDNRWINGNIDEISIWNAALTQDQIRDIMCRKLTQSYVDGMSGITWNSNLIGYYRFDESSGTNLPDVGPSSYDGTWYGSGGGSHTSPAWETSGAALGDASTHDYTSPSSVNLASSYGDDVTVGTITGSPDGVQIYRVNSAPNVTTPPAGLDQLSQSHYFGTYLIGGTNPTYTLTYNYQGHPGISNENNLELAFRSNNAAISWTDLDAALNTTDNTLIKTGQTGTEYILASSGDNSLTYNGPIWHISTTGSDITGTGAEQLPFATIQHGINCSSNTDIVLVQPGTYVENINYNGKLITVGSLFLTTQDTTYISSTTIDGNSSGSVVTFNNGENSSALLCGFTITNGSATNGGGIYCWYSNPSLQNLIISGNTALGHGGGIRCYEYSSPSLQNVTISGNSADYGGGINCNYFSNPSLQNVTISGNYAAIGGGIYCNYSNPSLVNVTITGNNAWYGGGISCAYSYPIFINSIHWNNSPQEIYINNASVTATYSDIQGGWAGTGNIDSDPLFVDPANGDYHLTVDSPCIDAGDPASPLDPDGTISDMGALYYDQTPGTGTGTSTGGELVVIDVIPIDFGSGLIDPDVTFDQNGTGSVTVDVVVAGAVQVGAPPPNPGNVDLSYALTFTGNTTQTFHMILSYSGYTGTPAYIAWWDGSVWQVPDVVVFTPPEVSFDITPLADRSGGEIEKGSRDGLRDGTFEFILGDDDPLPITLTNFSAQFINDNLTILWTTQSETNNLGWNIYRGETENALQNNTTFCLNNSGLIPGAGTTSEPTDYQFTDEYDVIVGQTYWYWLETVDGGGNTDTYGPASLTVPEEEPVPVLPQNTFLCSNYPNPFNPDTKIEFDIKEGENGSLTIYNLKGQLLVTHQYEAGNHKLVWDASQYGSGIYFYKLETQSYTKIKKMIMLK